MLILESSVELIKISGVDAFNIKNKTWNLEMFCRTSNMTCYRNLEYTTACLKPTADLF